LFNTEKIHTVILTALPARVNLFQQSLLVENHQRGKYH